MQSHLLQVQGLDAHLVIFNPQAAATLIALHGFSGEGSDFIYLSRHLPQFRIIAPDWFGHGRSSTPTATPAAALSWQLELLASILIHFPSPTALLGYSMGARIALNAAAADRLPQLPLLLIGCSPGLEAAGERADRLNADRQWADLLRSEGVAVFRQRWLQQPVLASQQALPPAIAADLAVRRSKQSPEGLAWCIDGLSPGRVPSLWQHLPQIRQPVHCITGSTDQKFLAIAEQMLLQLPRARHSVIANSGHSPHLEQPEQLALKLSKMLRSIDREL